MLLVGISLLVIAIYFTFSVNYFKVLNLNYLKISKRSNEFKKLFQVCWWLFHVQCQCEGCLAGQRLSLLEVYLTPCSQCLRLTSSMRGQVYVSAHTVHQYKHLKFCLPNDIPRFGIWECSCKYRQLAPIKTELDE